MVRQPLKIDRLPTELQDRITRERALGRTWEEIEEMSPTFTEWKACPSSFTKDFPGWRIPKTTLQRWYDLRVEQVMKEKMAQSEKAREIAAAFASQKFAELPEAIEGALRDQIFSLMQASDVGSRNQVIKELDKLARLMVQKKRVEILGERAKTEDRRVRLLEDKLRMMKRKFDTETQNAKRKISKGGRITAADIDRIRERTFGLPPVERSAPPGHTA